MSTTVGVTVRPFKSWDTRLMIRKKHLLGRGPKFTCFDDHCSLFRSYNPGGGGTQVQSCAPCHGPAQSPVGARGLSAVVIRGDRPRRGALCPCPWTAGSGWPLISVLDRQSRAQWQPFLHLWQRLGGSFCWVTGMVETRVLCLCVGHPLAKCPGWLHL